MSDDAKARHIDDNLTNKIRLLANQQEVEGGKFQAALPRSPSPPPSPVALARERRRREPDADDLPRYVDRSKRNALPVM